MIANNDWQETKKEFEINEKGEYIASHVTLERKKQKILGFEKKDFWEQLIKSIGIITIVIPLILFKCSRDADIDKQKNMLQLELFGNVLSDVQRIILLPDTSLEFKNSKNKLDIEYYSRMTMLGDDSIVNIYRALKDTINIYSLVTDANHILDTIQKHTRVIKDACKLTTVELSKLSNKPRMFKDSAIKNRSTALEKASVQWNVRRNLINSLNKSTTNLNDTLFDILTHLNRYVPQIRTYTNDTIRALNINLIDSLSTEFYKVVVNDRKKSGNQEKHLKDKIENYYYILNRMMKNINKILSTNGRT